MSLRPVFPSLAFLCLPAFSVLAQTPPVSKPTALGDPQLKLEVFAQYPDVETPTTVAAGATLVTMADASPTAID